MNKKLETLQIETAQITLGTQVIVPKVVRNVARHVLLRNMDLKQIKDISGLTIEELTTMQHET